MTKRRILRRRRLGTELRRLREGVGLTIDQVAEQLTCSASKISRIETGHTGVRPADVENLLGIYGVTGALREELLQAARDARQKGWWHPYSTVLTSAYVGLETEAVAVRTYEHQLVPGLLQTEEYARAMLRAARPDIGAEEVESRVRVRMRRQALLHGSDPLRVWAVLDEAVLSRPVGGDAVMRDQLEHLAEVTAMPRITLQVLPFSVGAHAGMDGTFAILDFAESAEASVVFAENATGGLFLEKENEVQKYQQIFDLLIAMALRPEESVAFITRVAKEPLWTQRPSG